MDYEATTEATRQEALQTLQEKYAGVKVCYGKLGASAKLTVEQKAEIAKIFGADPKALTAGKKLFNTRNSLYAACTAVIAQAKEYVKFNTLPWPDKSVTLLPREKLDRFQSKMEGLRVDLRNAVSILENRFSELMAEGQESLADLYNEREYNKDLQSLFYITYDYPNLTAPDYLKTVNPAQYEEQSRRIAARFDAAVSMAEEGFAAELAGFIEKLQMKLQGLDDGTEKRLKESTLDNLSEFFDKFRNLNIHSSAELDKVVSDAENVLKGRALFGTKPISRDDLRNSQALRADVKTRLSAVSAQLEGLMTTAPRRAIKRRAAAPQEIPADTTEPMEPETANAMDSMDLPL